VSAVNRASVLYLLVAVVGVAMYVRRAVSTDDPSLRSVPDAIAAEDSRIRDLGVIAGADAVWSVRVSQDDSLLVVARDSRSRSFRLWRCEPASATCQAVPHVPALETISAAAVDKNGVALVATTRPGANVLECYEPSGRMRSVRMPGRARSIRILDGTDFVVTGVFRFEDRWYGAMRTTHSLELIPEVPLDRAPSWVGAGGSEFGDLWIEDSRSWFVSAASDELVRLRTRDLTIVDRAPLLDRKYQPVPVTEIPPPPSGSYWPAYEDWLASWAPPLHFVDYYGRPAVVIRGRSAIGKLLLPIDGRGPAAVVPLSSPDGAALSGRGSRVVVAFPTTSESEPVVRLVEADWRCLTSNRLNCSLDAPAPRSKRSVTLVAAGGGDRYLEDHRDDVLFVPARSCVGDVVRTTVRAALDDAERNRCPATLAVFDSELSADRLEELARRVASRIPDGESAGVSVIAWNDALPIDAVADHVEAARVFRWSADSRSAADPVR